MFCLNGNSLSSRSSGAPAFEARQRVSAAFR